MRLLAHGQAWLRALFTAGRVMVLAYVAVIAALAWLLPWPEGGAPYRALRWMDAGARLSEELLAAPAVVTFEDRLRVRGERARLVNHYLTQPVAAGDPVLPHHVLAWPLLRTDEVVPFELEAEPNWSVLNAGSTVQIWVDDALKVPAARVLAIVPAGGTGWQALRAGSDVKPDSLGTPKTKPQLRVINLPRPGRAAP
jgi:hypothetical protein